MNRRSFLKASAVAPVALVIPAAATVAQQPAPPLVRDLVSEARMIGTLLDHGVMTLRDARAYFGLPEDGEF